MRANEFVLNEGRSSRRKQAQMNARGRAPTAAPTAPTAAPTASTAAPTAAPVQQSASKPAGTSFLDKIKQGMFNPNSASDKLSKRTDQIFKEKFIKDLKAAEQQSSGLRGEPLDLSNWVDDYLSTNRWSAGAQQLVLDKAIAANDKVGLATAMAAIGKFNNLGSSRRANAAPTAAPTSAPTAAPTAAPTGPAINPDGSITIAGAKGQSPSKIQPGDPMYKALAAAINKQTAGP